MQGDFAQKKCTNGKGNLYLTKNQFGRNKICYTEGNHGYISNMCAKEFSDWNFN